MGARDQIHGFDIERQALLEEAHECNQGVGAPQKSYPLLRSEGCFLPASRPYRRFLQE